MTQKYTEEELDLMFSVGALASREGTTPQVINAYVKAKENPLPVAQEKPRMIYPRVYIEWKAKQEEGRAQNKAERKQAAKEDRPPQSGALLELYQKQQQALMWYRGEGRGWALGVIDSKVQPFKSNYLEILNNRGKTGSSTVKTLMKEAAEGKLFFMDPDGVIAIVLGQLEAHPEMMLNEDLKRAVNSLHSALKYLVNWHIASGDANAMSLERIQEVFKQEIAQLEGKPEPDFDDVEDEE